MAWGMHTLTHTHTHTHTHTPKAIPFAIGRGSAYQWDARVVIPFPKRPDRPSLSLSLDIFFFAGTDFVFVWFHCCFAFGFIRFLLGVIDPRWTMVLSSCELFFYRSKRFHFSKKIISKWISRWRKQYLASMTYEFFNRLQSISDSRLWCRSMSNKENQFSFTDHHFKIEWNQNQPGSNSVDIQKKDTAKQQISNGRHVGRSLDGDGDGDPKKKEKEKQKQKINADRSRTRWPRRRP